MNISNCVAGLTLAVLTSAASLAQEAAPDELSARGGLPNFFGKLRRGEAVRIAYVGGSITAADGWRPMTFEWFQEQYPDATVTHVDAAHSGTSSDLACFRLKRDCLHHSPDMLFIEYGVNDSAASTEWIYRGIEGIIRQARRANPMVDICIVYTLREDMVKGIQEGKFPHTYEAMEIIADHYDLPSIRMGMEVVRLEKEGKLLFKGEYPETDAEKAELGDRILFSCDGVHPLREGHALYRDAVARAMKKMGPLGEPGPAPLPEPFREDNFEYVQPTSLSQVGLSNGWQKLDPATHPIAKRFQVKLPELWFAEKPGESITVRFKGTSILLYDVVGPDCGQVIFTIDDEEPRIIPRFDAWSQDHRVYFILAATDLENTEHLARFEIHPEQPDKAAIVSWRKKTIDDPEKYDGTRWYVGDVLVTGEVLPVE
jgi:lysophospholipase L1-like esterase